MHSSSRLKLTTTCFSLFVLLFGLALFGSMRATTHAAGTPSKRSAQSGMSRTSSCGAWSIEPSANVRLKSDVINAVATVSATNAWAVGFSFINGKYKTLIEQWNGTSWNTVPSPNVGVINILNAVTAISATDIWAVGYSSKQGPIYPVVAGRTLIEHWDGTSWKIVPSPNAGTSSVLYGVSKVPNSSQLWAVGYHVQKSIDFQQTLIQYWDGASWKIVPSSTFPEGSGVLYAITVNTANNAWAVGDYLISPLGFTQTLTEQWNGRKWSIVPSPNAPAGAIQNVLTGVARVPGTNQLWAVGDAFFGGTPDSSYQLTLIEQWNGTSWSVVPSPSAGIYGVNNNNLTGVAVVSATDVWAVGYWNNIYTDGTMTPLQTLIEQWNGTSWNIVPSPNTGTGSVLYGVSQVPNSSQLWAVGGYSQIAYGSLSQTLAEFYC